MIPGPAATHGSYEWRLRIGPKDDDGPSDVFSSRKSEVTLGRSLLADVVIEDDALDPKHFHILLDLTGRHWVLAGHTRAVLGRLYPGERWEMGNHCMTLLGLPRRVMPVDSHPANPEQHSSRKSTPPLTHAPPTTTHQSPSYALELQVEHPDESGPRRHSFQSVREIDMGRSRERMLTLPYSGVGRLHATLIITERGEVLLRDHCSVNGTLINHTSVQNVALVLPRDVISIGDAKISLLTAPEPLNAQAQAMTKDTKRALRGRRYLPRFGSSRAAQAQWQLVLEVRDRVEQNGQQLINYNMTFKRDVILIGRARDNDLVLPAPNISKYHAILRISPQGDCFVTRVSTVRNMFLGEEEIAAERRITTRDRVSIGLYTLRVVEFSRLP